MRDKTKGYMTTITLFLVLSLVLIPMAAAAGSITLTPTAQAPGASVSVAGTGFGATRAVSIGFGAEGTGSTINMAYTGTGMGPYAGRVSNWPIKPGSFVLTSDTGTGGLVSTYTDNGDGTTTGSFEGAVGTINYVTGAWTRITTVDVTDFPANYSATYIRYEYNATPPAGVTTTASGILSASITVPAVADGNYNVTSIDTQGNRAVALLNVSVAIPEVLPIGIVMLLSSFAVLVGSRFFGKKPRIGNRS